MYKVSKAITLLATALFVLGCQLLASGSPTPTATAPPSATVSSPLLSATASAAPSMSPAPTATAQPTASPSGWTGPFPLCDQVPQVVAPAEYYGDSPIYVSNEQPTARLRKWAEKYPGFEMLWIDREHHGWVVLAFSVDAEAREADVKREFPGVGVAVAPVTWNRAHLEELQTRAMGLQIDGGPLVWSAGAGNAKGVVSLNIGVLSPERIAAIDDAFHGEPVCLEGAIPRRCPHPVLNSGSATAGVYWRTKT